MKTKFSQVCASLTLNNTSACIISLNVLLMGTPGTSKTFFLNYAAYDLISKEQDFHVCVYAFMRLWGGLIFRNWLSCGPSPCGGAARFPSLETVRTVTSPAMPTQPG
jgi:hypothetical protein